LVYESGHGQQRCVPAACSSRIALDQTHSLIFACIASSERGLSPFSWTAAWKKAARATGGCQQLVQNIGRICGTHGVAGPSSALPRRFSPDARLAPGLDEGVLNPGSSGGGRRLSRSSSSQSACASFPVSLP
jgi:hypothetical protein